MQYAIRAWDIRILYIYHNFSWANRNDSKMSRWQDQTMCIYVCDLWPTNKSKKQKKNHQPENIGEIPCEREKKHELCENKFIEFNLVSDWSYKPENNVSFMRFFFLSFWIMDKMFGFFLRAQFVEPFLSMSKIFNLHFICKFEMGPHR